MPSVNVKIILMKEMSFSQPSGFIETRHKVRVRSLNSQRAKNQFKKKSRRADSTS